MNDKSESTAINKDNFELIPDLGIIYFPYKNCKGYMRESVELYNGQLVCRCKITNYEKDKIYFIYYDYNHRKYWNDSVSSKDWKVENNIMIKL